MIAYPAMLDVPTELAEFLAGLLAAERVNRGTRTPNSIIGSSVTPGHPSSRAARAPAIAPTAGGRACALLTPPPPLPS